MNYWIVNTDEGELEGVGAEKNMLLHSCVAAWKDPTGTTEWASLKLSQPEAGDRVFFYKNKVGVIATALFDHTDPFPSNAVFGLRHRGEFNRKVFDLKTNPTRLLSCRAIEQATGENFRVLQTIFRIKNLKIAEFLEESF